MGTLVEETCFECEKRIQVRIGEYNRAKKLKRNLFCSLSCVAKFRSRTRPDKRVMVRKKCPQCEKEFEALTGAKSKTFCSRGCASAGSVTEKRRAKAKIIGRQNLPTSVEDIARTLRKREAWKYAEIKKLLDWKGIVYEFEWVIGPYIFDLALVNKDILIEFDGPYHSGKQLEADEEKKKYAEKRGWKVVRIEVIPNQVIVPSTLYDLLKED